MGGQEYKNKKNSKVLLILIIFCFFVFVFLISFLIKNNKNNNDVDLKYDSLTTVREVIEYYKSKYISEENSKESRFNLDIYLELAKMPYTEDDKSNEKYYNSLLEDVAKVINYNNYRMIDKKNEIYIDVICRNKSIDKIVINGIEDYFIYMDSQISMKKYKEIPVTSIEITSDLLKECINNNWSYHTNFGTKESTFEQYDIYFDEGICVKSISSEVYNIIFTERYGKNVINNIYPGMNIEDIKDVLGNPTFFDEELEVIGYKSDNIYVFFNNNSISIYRFLENDNQIAEFLELFDKYLSDSNDELLEFMNNLTYMWPDYNEYTYSSNYFFISYPLKGIEIKVNYDDTNGILVYNNIKGNINEVERYLENTDFVARLEIDSVFEAEKRRISKEKELANKCNEYKEELNNDETNNSKGESLLYNILPEKDSNNQIFSIKFISTTGQNPNRELYDGISSYLWISNNEFLYSKPEKGIFLYDLNIGKVSRVLEGKEVYNLESYDNGIIKYDDGKTIAIR